MRDEPEETSLSGLAGGCCFDFSKHSEHLFVVGTEEGRVHKCRFVNFTMLNILSSLNV
jgi:dynein intermediate chain 1, axonemal